MGHLLIEGRNEDTYHKQGECCVKTEVMLLEAEELPEASRKTWNRFFPNMLRGNIALLGSWSRTIIYEFNVLSSINIISNITQKCVIIRTHNIVPFVNFKSMHILNLRVQFYLGQNEDYSLEGRISQSFKIPLQRGRGNICDFGEGGGTCNQAHILQKVAASLVKITASHEEQASPWRILALF